MRASKRKKLEADGWKVGLVADFLGLTPEEELLVEMKLALANNLRARRRKMRITQERLAKQIGSSQSRVAKIEKADKSVSMDLLVSSLASLGASRKEIGGIIGATVIRGRDTTYAKSKGSGKSAMVFRATRRLTASKVRAAKKKRNMG